LQQQKLACIAAGFGGLYTFGDDELGVQEPEYEC
jgi:hypothetical protein